MDTIKHLDSLVVPYLNLADQADKSDRPVLAETRAFMLEGEIEARRLLVLVAPQVASSGSRPDHESPATQGVLTALMNLRNDQFMTCLLYTSPSPRDS